LLEHEFDQQTKAIQRQIYYYAKTLTKNHDDAQEILQDTLALAWRWRDKYDPKRSALGTWIIYLYRRIIQARFEQCDAVGYDSDTISINDLIDSDGESISDELVVLPQLDDRISVEQALSKLGGIHEMISRMCFIGGYTYNEVADELHLTKSKVRRIVASSLRRLRYILTSL